MLPTIMFGTRWVERGMHVGLRSTQRCQETAAEAAP